MLIYILFVISSVALTTAQSDVGPQTFSDVQPSLSSLTSDKGIIDDRGFKYIIAPIRFNNPQNIKSNNRQLSQQNLERQELLPLINFLPNEDFEVRNPEQVQELPELSNQNVKLNYQNPQGLRFFSSLAEEKPKQQYKLVRIQQGNQLQKQSNAIAQYSNKDQIERDLLEQLRIQLSRIVDNNRSNLKDFSILSEEKQILKAAQPERLQSNNQEEQGKVELRKEIENILRSQDNLELVKQNANEAEDSNFQKSPFFVQRLVSVVKHHPVNIVKQVKVAVPTPVLVPVPEPYEVKVPHPYHVPVEVIRHIPVPIVRGH